MSLESHRSNPDDRVLRGAQLFALAAMNIFFLVGVGGLLVWGYKPHHHSLTPGFWLSELVIIFVAFGTLAASSSFWVALESVLGDWSANVRRWTARFKRRSDGRDTALMAVVVILNVFNIVPFAWLVVDTGGVTTSPFTPLITVPALFSAFLAKRGRSILGLASLGTAAFLILTLAGFNGDPTGSLSTSSFDGATTVSPRPIDFALVAGSVMFAAAALSAARKPA